MSRDMEEVPREFSVPAFDHGLNRRVGYRIAAPVVCMSLAIAAGSPQMKSMP